MSSLPRLYLSPPHIGEMESRYVQEAFTSNWVAPLGPNLDAFEREMSAYTGIPHVCALSSGTAALHLALELHGIGRGDRVWCSTLTFAGSAFPIRYVGAEPVFIDSDRTSWNIDPDLLSEALATAATKNELPKAMIVVDLYGQCADHDRIAAACAHYGVTVIEDAAEALGARYKDRSAGSFGTCAIFSFNGNKIITTSGGGMLVSHDRTIIDRARHLATQARDPAPWYQHSVVGYNYRLSNISAGIGRGQLQVLDARVAARRRIFDRYKQLLGAIPGLTFMPEALFGDPRTRATRWLTVAVIDPAICPVSAGELQSSMNEENIEARVAWKPMHQQPIFSSCQVIGGAVAEFLFRNGLCLPSGSAMSDADIDRVVDALMRRIKR